MCGCGQDVILCFFFSSRRRHTRSLRDWSSDVCSSDLWQQVTVEVSGRGGGRAARTWDVGVVPPTPPVLEEVTPPAGSVALAQGEQGSFRCRARVPAARPGDRLAFEWMLDDRPVRREEQPAADAISDLAL